MKKYNQAPLPFVGQKRRFVKKVSKLLSNAPKDAIYIDLFGGSGLLAHTVKYVQPDAEVIYNDFDNYSERLRNVKQTNALLSEVRQLFDGLPRNKKVPKSIKKKLLELVTQHQKKTGYVDYITLSTSVLFSMNYANNLDELKSQTIYNAVRRSDYSVEGYLEGVEVVREDYRSLFERYKNDERAIFLVDPPYLSTEIRTYKNVTHWGITDYLDVLNVLNGTKYIYFTSNKSEIVELCEWFETRSFQGSPFQYATTTTVNQRVNYNSEYTEIMLHKLVD